MQEFQHQQERLYRLREASNLLVCSWYGKIVSNIWWNDDDGKFWFNVRMAAHHGTGDSQLICEGIVGDRFSLMGACIDEHKIAKEKIRQAFKSAA